MNEMNDSESRERVLDIEGKKVRVQATLSNGLWWVDFAIEESLAAFCANNRTGASPWLELVNWRAPRSALGSIWCALRELTNWEPMAFQALDDARHAAAYLRLLNRCKVRAVARIRDLNTVVIYIK